MKMKLQNQDLSLAVTSFRKYIGTYNIYSHSLSTTGGVGRYYNNFSSKQGTVSGEFLAASVV